MNGTVDTLTPPAGTSIEEPGGVTSSVDRAHEQGSRILERLFSAAQPGAVYSPPVVSGQYTVITASEVSVGGGVGLGKGFGPNSAPAGDTAPGPGVQLVGGGGMGGGGGSIGRPVATIVIGPDGVKVVPIVDVTKVALAGITAWGAMLVAIRKMRRGGK